ncbi:DUF4403 family protein [Mesonia sp. MT50]|uniref:DUF4403 family protein n=1 Tax=Mesonia profundi TaxID=3070998 RepID=A0ABU1A3R9_9FLAO|nr:DUF4403 family protein [Mesonia profundi]MDQ7917578.1 DUF4403 family protein [Mesonia profundi]
MEPVKERDAKSEEENFQEGVFIHIPVKIRLEALEKVFQQKLVGYIIQEDDSEDAKQFGEILSIHLSPGIEGYDLLVQQEIKMKTMLFSNKIVKFHFQLKLSYNADEQELQVNDYRVEGEQKSWFANQALKVMMNSIFRNKILKMSKISLLPKLQDLVKDLNKKLAAILEVKKGILLFGNIDKFKIVDLYVKEDCLVARLELAGVLAAEVYELEID